MMPLSEPPIDVAWISDFPVEWLPDAPQAIRSLPRCHPLSWQRVLLAELEQEPDVRINIIVLRKGVSGDINFMHGRSSIHVLKSFGGMRLGSLFWWDTVRIRRRLRQINPHLVHAWGTERGAALVASRLPYRYLVTMQGLITWYRELAPLSFYHRCAAVLEDLSLARAQVATTESTFAVQYLRRRYRKLRVVQAEHAPNWIFHRIKRSPQTGPVRFIYVGVISRIKGTDLLLRALDKLSSKIEFQLIVVGDPGGEAALTRLHPTASGLLRSRIEFRGKLSPEEVAQELARATIMLFPTRADTSPNAVKEAVVAGVPVVASRIGGIPDYVLHGSNGLLFESDNIEAFVSAIAAACDHPFFRVGQVDTAHLAKVRDYLAPSRMGETFARLYRESARESKSATSQLSGAKQ